MPPSFFSITGPRGSLCRVSSRQPEARPAEDKIDYKEAGRTPSLSLSLPCPPSPYYLTLSTAFSTPFTVGADFQARAETARSRDGVGGCRYRDVTPAFFTGTPLTSHYEHLSGSSSVLLLARLSLSHFPPVRSLYILYLSPPPPAPVPSRGIS